MRTQIDLDKLWDLKLINKHLKTENNYLKNEIEYLKNKIGELQESYILENMENNLKDKISKSWNLVEENETLKRKIEFLHNQRDEILENADCSFHTEDTEFAKAEYINDFKKEFGEI